MNRSHDKNNMPETAGGAIGPTVTPAAHAGHRHCPAPRLHQLEHDVRAICRRNPQGTQEAQSERLRTLLLCARQLFEQGVCRKRAVNLHADPIRALVDVWHAEGRTAATIRNRLMSLRWLAKKIGKPAIVGSDRFFGVDRSHHEKS